MEKEMTKVFISEKKLQQLYDLEELEKRRSGYYASKFQQRWGFNLRASIMAATEEMVNMGDAASLLALSQELHELAKEVEGRVEQR